MRFLFRRKSEKPISQQPWFTNNLPAGLEIAGEGGNLTPSDYPELNAVGAGLGKQNQLSLKVLDTRALRKQPRHIISTTKQFTQGLGIIGHQSRHLTSPDLPKP